MSADPTRTSPPADLTRTAGDGTRSANPPILDTPTLDGDPAPLPDAPPGFVVEKVLGVGGMGVVYLARQVGLNRPIALKLIQSGDTGSVLRFLAEAEAMAAVQHPNVAEVYQFGEHHGRPFLVLEHCSGGDLNATLRAGKLAPTAAAKLLLAVADGVAAAHAAGIVHRDLKPHNVLLTANGTPKVTDFGLAKREGGSDLTKTMAVMGTPAYMPPEQAKGETKFAGPQADVWALGVMLYEALTGTRPFTGADHWAVLAAVQRGTFAAPRSLVPDLPRDLELVCLKCLKADPQDRYATAGELASDLRNWLEGKPISARPAGLIEQAVKWAKRNKKVAGLVAAVMLATTAGAVTASVFAVRASRSEADAVGKAREATAAQKEATAAQKAAEEATAEARRRLVRLYVAAGARAEDAGDFGTALHWYQKAWDQDRDDPESDPSHRLRIGGVLNEMPHLLGACFQAEKVCDASFSPDGTRIVTRGEGNEAVVWDYERSTPAVPPLVHAGRVRHVCFSPDGRSVATASADGTAVVWETASGAKRYTLKHDGPLTWVAFHPDGTRVLTTAEDKTVRMWDAGTGAPKEWKLPYDAVVDHAAFSPDGTRLLTAGRDNTTRVWSVDPPAALSPAITYSASSDQERYTFNYDRWPRFSPDGKTVVSFKGKDLFVWPGGEGMEVRKVTLPYIAIECHFVGDADRLFVTGNNNNVGIVRLSDGKFEVRHTHTRNVNIGAASPDGKWFLAPISGGRVHLWSATAAEVKSPSQVFPCTDFCSAVSFTPDGTRILTASQDGAVRVWATEPNRNPTRPYGFDCGRAHNYPADGKPGQARRVWSPDGQHTVEFGQPPDAIRLVSAKTGLVREHRVNGEAIRVQFCENGQRFSTFTNTHARTWLTATGEPVGPDVPMTKQLVQWASAVPSKMSLDGTRLAMTDDPRTISVWDMTTGRRLFGPTRHPNLGPHVFGPNGRSGEISDCALSPDGTRLVVATDSHGTLSVWDVSTGQILHHNRRYTGEILGVGISDDGRKLGAAWDKGAARVFVAETGEPIGPAFRRDGTLIIGDMSNDARLMISLDSDGLTYRLCDVVRGERLLSLRRADQAPLNRFWLSLDLKSLVMRNPDGSYARQDLPRFDAPADTLAPLAQFLTGQQIDAFDGIEAVDPFTFRGDPAKYRRAYREWKGLPADD